MKLRKVVGIDLGSSNSSIAHWTPRGPEVIKVDGSDIMPSVVTIVPADAVAPGDSQIFVGLDGIEAGKRYRDYCYRNFKRRLAQPFNENEDHGPQIVEGKDDETREGTGLLAYQGPDGYTYPPLTMCSAVISKLLDSAAIKFNGERPDAAVICVPPNFTLEQIAEVEEAGRMAGLKFIETMAEPTAAAVASGASAKRVERMVVVDVGGGTSDVSIVQAGHGRIEVIATAGSSITGGSDVDAILGRYIVGEWAQSHDGVDLAVDDTAMTLVLQESEQAKIRLSRKQKTDLRIKDFDRTPGGEVLHLDHIVDRPLLEHLSKDILARIRRVCEIAISDAQRKDPNFNPRHDIKRVLLVGGGTEMPAVQALVADVFGQRPRTDLDPQTAVVLGAAIRGAVLEGRKNDLTIQDIISYSVAVEVYDKVEGVASIVIPRGTPFPSERAESFFLTNREPGQTSLPVRIVTGDESRAALCDLLHAIDVPLEPGEPRSARVPFTVGLSDRGTPYGRVGEVEWGEA